MFAKSITTENEVIYNSNVHFCLQGFNKGTSFALHFCGWSLFSKNLTSEQDSLTPTMRQVQYTFSCSFHVPHLYQRAFLQKAYYTCIPPFHLHVLMGKYQNITSGWRHNPILVDK